jgi:hypothetical protein
VYGWLWRIFPGGLIGKVVCSILLAAAATVLLFLFVFPRVESLLPFQDVTVDNGSSSTPSPSAAP